VPETKAVPEGPFKKISGGLSLKIKVEPRSSRRGFFGLQGDAIKVKLTSAPTENKANEELIQLLAKTFGVRKSAVKIVRGMSSKQKIVEIEGDFLLEKKLKEILF
jgi:uncharacterized protein (TIGR00251 family)